MKKVIIIIQFLKHSFYLLLCKRKKESLSVIDNYREWSVESEFDWKDGYDAPSLSLPHILKIVNIGTTAIANVDVGDAAINQFAKNQGVNPKITITHTLANNSYIRWLGTTNTKPFMVGKTMVVSSTTKQLKEKLTMTSFESNPNGDSENIDFALSPRCPHTDRVVNFRQYIFSGLVRLRFSNILASTTLYLYLYPLKTFKK